MRVEPPWAQDLHLGLGTPGLLDTSNRVGQSSEHRTRRGACDAKVERIENVRGFGWEVVHAAVWPTRADFPRHECSPYLRDTRTPRKFGMCPSFKDHSLSPRANPRTIRNFGIAVALHRRRGCAPPVTVDGVPLHEDVPQVHERLLLGRHVHKVVDFVAVVRHELREVSVVVAADAMRGFNSKATLVWDLTSA
jgi:hypothetical protein